MHFSHICRIYLFRDIVYCAINSLLLLFFIYLHLVEVHVCSFLQFVKIAFSAFHYFDYFDYFDVVVIFVRMSIRFYFAASRNPLFLCILFLIQINVDTIIYVPHIRIAW